MEFPSSRVVPRNPPVGIPHSLSLSHTQRDHLQRSPFKKMRFYKSRRENQNPQPLPVLLLPDSNSRSRKVIVVRQHSRIPPPPRVNMRNGYRSCDSSKKHDILAQPIRIVTESGIKKRAPRLSQNDTHFITLWEGFSRQQKRPQSQSKNKQQHSAPWSWGNTS